MAAVKGGTREDAKMIKIQTRQHVCTQGVHEDKTVLWHTLEK